MSWKLTGIVSQKRVGSTARKLLLLAMADKATDDGEGVYASVATLCAMSECTRSTVKRILKEFVAEGLIEHVGTRACKNGETNEYALNVDKISALPSVNRVHSEPGPEKTGSTVNRDRVHGGPPTGSTVDPKPKNKPILEPRLPLTPSGEGEHDGEFLPEDEIDAPRIKSAPPSPSKPKAKSGGVRRVCTLPEDWEPRDDERQVALGELKMTAAEYRDALESFREWAGANGRRFRAGSEPNWDLAFRNHLRRDAKSIGSAFRKQAPEKPIRVGSADGGALPEGPDWWRSIAERVAGYDAKFWRSIGPLLRGEEREGKRIIIAEAEWAADRAKVKFGMLGIEAEVVSEPQKAAVKA